MNLTPTQQTLIEKPFALHEHGFNGDEPYVLRLAIYHRLNEVDSNWAMGKPICLNIGQDTVTIAQPLTIAGDTRWGIGKATVQHIEESSNESAKAKRMAEAAAFTVAFLQFGGAAYLKDKPSHIKRDDFPRWLAELTPQPNTPTGASVPPAIGEDLNAWFPESSKPAESAPAAEKPVDKMNAVYQNKLGFRSTARTAKSPTANSETITWFRIHPNDISEGDIYRSGNGPITTALKELKSDEAGVRVFDVQECEERGGAMTQRTIRLNTSLVMLVIVGGPKLDAVQTSLGLTEITPLGRTWRSQRKGQAAS